MLTSDHGFTLGHHGIPREKGFLYEHSLRVPMLVSGPGIPRGVTSTFAGTHIDLAPTILSLANITAPAWMDGSSLLPIMITAINTEQRQIPPTVQAHLNSVSSRQAASLLLRRTRYQLAMHYNQGPWTRYHAHISRNYDDWSNTFVAIVSNGGVEGDIKLGLYDPYGKQTGFASPRMYELFNLTADPYETTNVYTRTRRDHPQLVDDLIAKMRELHGCVGAACTAAAAGPEPPSPPPRPADVCDAMRVEAASGGAAYCQMCFVCSAFCPRCG